VLAAELSLAEHGAQLLPALARPLLDALAAVASRLPEDRAGTRIAGDPQTAELLGPDGLIDKAVASLKAEPQRPVRAILFDKNDAANWSLGWHQDRTIAVRQRREVPGYRRWTIKQGLQHVEPPFAVIERMTTVRIHLDPVDEENAPLRVALGTHRLGPISDDRTDAVAETNRTFSCLAEAGDVWAYATPIIHSSHAAAPGRRRRVLQVDYSADRLRDGLEWLGI
jgi:hypothetical protein